MPCLSTANECSARLLRSTGLLISVNASWGGWTRKGNAWPMMVLSATCHCRENVNDISARCSHGDSLNSALHCAGWGRFAGAAAGV